MFVACEARRVNIFGTLGTVFAKIGRLFTQTSGNADQNAVDLVRLKCTEKWFSNFILCLRVCDPGNVFSAVKLCLAKLQRHEVKS